MFRDPELVDQLLDELSLPEEAEKMLWDPRFWYEDVCLQIFERVDELVFTIPKDALPLAEVGRALVSRVPPEHCEGGRVDALAAKAYMVYGSALRAGGQPIEASFAYAVAELYFWEEGTALERADLWLRVAVLLTVLQDYPQAEGYVVDALGNYQTWGRDESLIGKALHVRGYLYSKWRKLGSALRDFGSSLQHLNAVSDHRLFLGSLINFGYLLQETAPDQTTLDLAREKLEDARCACHYPEDSLVGLKLIWVEGRIYLKSGDELEAERIYRRVQGGMIEIGSPYEQTEIGIDLAELLFQQGRHDEVIAIVSEIFPILHDLRKQKELYKAMTLFYNAALEKALTQAIISRARAALHRVA